MQRRRSAFRAAALLELLATTARTGIVAADLRATTNDRCNFLLTTMMMKVGVEYSSRLAAALLFPVGVDSHERRFNPVHPRLDIPRALCNVDTLVGTEAQKWREPCRLSHGEQTPRIFVEHEAGNEALVPLGSTPLNTPPEDWLE